MNDLICREDAIEAAYQGLRRPNNDPIWERIYDELCDVPPAQPWIPISERFPEPNEMDDDVISRQVAITAFYKYPNVKWPTLDVMGKIRELPSAQQWIPVSVRLPKKEGWYYCTVSADIGGYARELYFEKGRFLDKIRINMFELYNITSKVTGEKILEDSFDWTDVVTAWMPLPEPMKGEGE